MRLVCFAAITGLFLLGSVAAAQRVTYDFEKAADSSRFKTYAWVHGTEIPDRLNHARVVAARLFKNYPPSR